MAGILWMVIVLILEKIISPTYTEPIRPRAQHILRYEKLDYNRDDLHGRHIRSTGNSYLHFTIRAYGRAMPLLLQRDTSQHTTGFLVTQWRQLFKPDLSFIYTGEVIGEPGSSVYGAIINGTFQGTIDLPGDTTYTIAPSRHVFDELPPFHSIIYSDRDLDWQHLQGSIDNDRTSTPHSGGPIYRHSEHTYPMNRNDHSPHSHWTRLKRDVQPPFPRKRICTLKLTADHVMWDYMMRRNNQIANRARNEILYIFKSHVAKLNSIFGKTKFIANRGTPDEKIFSGIQFEIRNVTILDWDHCYDMDGNWRDADLCAHDANANLLDVFADMESKATGDVDYKNSYDPDFENSYDPDYEYVTEYETTDYNSSHIDIDSTGFANTTKADSWDVCLSYLFTARVLYITGSQPPRPQLGVAFHAVPDTIAGVCIRGGNFGLVTLLQINSQTYLPPTVTQLVFAHEVGHSFGAHHDNNVKCSKYFHTNQRPAGGHFLMYSITQRGQEINNEVFSNCSREFIDRILSDDHYTRCFQESEAPFCGNSIVEVGEECDCGMAGLCDDRCCHAMGANPNNTKLDCTLKQGVKCSPSQGPCCDGRTCSTIPRADNFVCQNAKPCMDALHCDGARSGDQCPAPTRSQVREDNFLCNTNGRVCDKGECNGSMCRLIFWRECQTMNNNDRLTIPQKEELCYVACQKKKSTECISTSNKEKVEQNAELLSLLYKVYHQDTGDRYPVRLPIGTPCNNAKGYCDVFHRCRGVDPDTPLVRLKNCLTSGKCLQTVLQYLRDYWWAVALLTISGVTFLTFVVCVCSVHTKSDNPILERQNPSLKWRQTIRNPRKSFRKSSTRFKRSFSRSVSQYDAHTMYSLTRQADEVDGMNGNEENGANEEKWAHWEKEEIVEQDPKEKYEGNEPHVADDLIDA